MTHDPSVDTPPSKDELAKALLVNVLDQEGKSHRFGDLIKDRSAAVLFIRHFFCGVCQSYIEQLGRAIPPENLPSGRSIIIIGCGQPSPIANYVKLTKSPYEIYTNPSLELYRLFNFVAKLEGAKPGEEKGYARHLGSAKMRFWNSFKNGPLKNPSLLWTAGPTSQNGGEVVFEQDGSISFFHRMQNTMDHSELEVIAEAIEATYTPVSADPNAPTSCELGVKV